MISMDVMHFKNDGFNISVDADADQEDNRLHQELKQLIAEQFEDFDLGDENDNTSDNHSCFSDEAHEAYIYDGIEQNTEEIASINAAGKLSLLEGAIQKFGEDDTQASEDTVTDNLTTKGTNKTPFDQNLHVTDTCNSNSNDNEKAMRDAELWNETVVQNSEVRGFTETTDMPAVKLFEGSEVPHCTDKTIDWELSFPGEIGNELFMALQKDRDTVISPLQATEVNTHQPECHAPSPVDEMIAYNNSPTVTHSLKRQLSGLSSETFSWPQTAIPGPKPTDPSHVIPSFAHVMQSHPQWTVNETTTSVSEGYAQLFSETDELRSNFPTQLPLNPDERRDLLYAARGRQLEDLLAEVNRLREEITKEKRLANHRATLAEGERESLRSQLSASEKTVQLLRKELQDNEERLSKLRQQLTDSETSNNKLNNEIINLRTTNESLSTQLVELTTGDAVRRAEEREGKLTEALQRRYSVVAEEVKAELTAANKRLADKEKEIAGLQRQIEAYKSDLKKAQDDHNDQIRQANQQLEESQQHCQKLASSVLCTEVVNLRQKVYEFETSKKITDDVNAILQNELRDLREQVSLYERMLKLDEVPAEDQFPGGGYADCRPSSCGLKECDISDPKDSLPNFYGNQQHPKARPSSAAEKAAEDHQELEEYTKLHTGNPLDNTRRRAHFAHSDPSMRTEPEPSETGHEAFQSLSRQGILTSTPAPRSPMMRLRVELERCLANYKAKREEITKLHETLFTTRCQLHQATEASQKAEKNVTVLQDRVLSLERELTSTRELNGTPGPRESALSGQLDRLKADYAKLEEELQATRTRLQTALGAEARALENEKAASERLAASTAERDAAVDRARAVCESHYTAMRRRLEIDWANERESMERLAEDKLNKVRQELNECEMNLSRVTKLYQESQMATQEAVETALREAMQERENERIRFWREELPRQLESARATWEQEWSHLRDMAVRQAVDECREKLSAAKPTEIDSARAQLESRDVAHVGTFTESMVSLDCASQTDMQVLLSVSGTQSRPSESGPNPLVPLTVLPKFMSASDLQCLRVQLLETNTLNLGSLDRLFRVFIRRRCKFYSKQSWCLMSLALHKLFDEFKLDTIINTSDDILAENPAISVADLDTLANVDIDPECSRSRSSMSVFSASSDNLSDPENRGVNQPSEQQQSETTGNSVRESVLLRLRQMAKALFNTHKALESASSKPPAEQVTSGPNLMSSELYNLTLRKIKQEVLNYAETCQTRAAETLHSELARVHRRACRQFTAHLRRALYDARASGSPTMLADSVHSAEARFVFPRRLTRSAQTSRDVVETPASRHPSLECKTHLSVESTDNKTQSTLSRTPPDFESLLHMIDEVCESTEKKFQPNLPTNSPLFEPPASGEQIQPLEFRSFMNSSSSVTGRLQSTDSIGVTLDAQSTPSCLVSGDLKKESKSEHENSTTAFSSTQKIPARTKAKLAWIQQHPTPSLPPTPASQGKNSDEDCQSRVSDTSKPTALFERPSVFVPIRTSDTRPCKPIPAPRLARPISRPVSESSAHSVASLHTAPADKRTASSVQQTSQAAPAIGTTLGAVRPMAESEHRINVDLYNLFEQLSGSQEHK